MYCTGHFSGHGRISAIGGRGHGSAGGGAGGRIAVHTWDSNFYKGALLAYGSGGTSGGDIGGPGTVFVEDKMDAYTYQSRSDIKTFKSLIQLYYICKISLNGKTICKGYTFIYPSLISPFVSLQIDELIAQTF